MWSTAVLVSGSNEKKTLMSQYLISSYELADKKLLQKLYCSRLLQQLKTTCSFINVVLAWPDSIVDA